MSEQFDPADYSFVVKRRGNPQKPWRWEIYCAGKSSPVKRSSVCFESMAEAAKEGKSALGHFLSKKANRPGGKRPGGGPVPITPLPTPAR